MDELFFITPARLGLTDARSQVPAGWEEICAVVERSLPIRIQTGLPWGQPHNLLKIISLQV